MFVRKHLEDAQYEIEKQLIRFSSIIAETLTQATEAVLSRDIITAKKLVTLDKTIDKEQQRIEDNCVRLIATEHPVASDLRSFVAYIKTASLYEKIADYIKTMCSKLELVSQQQIDSLQVHINEQKKVLFEMLDGTINALIKKDASLARKTAEMDDSLDKNYRKHNRKLIRTFDGQELPNESVLSLISLIRTFERIGDMLSIINELTIYAIDGTHVDLN